MADNKETTDKLVHEWVATMTACVMQPSGRLTAIKAQIESALDQKDVEAATAQAEAREKAFDEAIAIADSYGDSIGNPSKNIVAALQSAKGSKEPGGELAEIHTCEKCDLCEDHYQPMQPVPAKHPEVANEQQ